MGYWQLFASAFVSSTILPGGSEVLLAYMVNAGGYRVEMLVAVATLGNTLGALTTWGLGAAAAAKFPVAALLPEDKRKALAIVQAKGLWALFFSWLPVIGDAFCFIGGWLKLPFASAMLVIFLGKLARYLVVAGLFV